MAQLQPVKSRPTPWDIHDLLVGMDQTRHTPFLHHPNAWIHTFPQLAFESMDLHQARDWNRPPPKNQHFHC
jgi:hypothetical protein